MNSKPQFSHNKIELLHRISLILLIVFVCASAFCGCVSADFSGGDGTQDNPYQIQTAADLQNLSKNVSDGNNYSGKYFQVTKEINLESVCDAASDTSWIPIGTNSSKPFCGTFYGNDSSGTLHTISNLYINNSSADYQGLFGYAVNANFTNVDLKNVNITGKNCVGGLIGNNTVSTGSSTITNCYASGNVSGRYKLGGLIGSNIVNGHSTIENCHASVNVSIINGGIEAVSAIGGSGSGGDGKTEEGISTVEPKIGGDDALGSSKEMIGEIIGTSDYVGGLIGINIVNSKNSDIKIEKCHASGNVSGNSKLGGLIGSNKVSCDSCKIIIENCYATGNVSSINSGKSGGTVKTDTIGPESTLDSKTSGVTIITEKEKEISKPGKPGGGGGISKPGGGSIISVEKGVNGYYVGGLIGYNELSDCDGCVITIEKCNASGDVSGKNMLGGLIGNNKVSVKYSKFIIQHCHASGNVSGKSKLGGLIGSNIVNGCCDFIIQHCHASGNVSSINSGKSGGTVKTDTIRPESTLDSKTSGVTIITEKEKEISKPGKPGGGGGISKPGGGSIISVEKGVNGYYVGGLIGYNIVNGQSRIENCYAIGDVNCTNNIVGGLIGNNTVSSGSSTIENCYAAGNVSGNSKVGGLIGNSVINGGKSSYINKSAALNWYVNGSSEVGRIIGNNTGDGTLSLNNNYGWEGMKYNSSNPNSFFTENISHNKWNGTNVSSMQAWGNESFYKNDLNWEFDANNWKIEADNNLNYPLPYITSLNKKDTWRPKVIHLKPLIVKFNKNSESAAGDMNPQGFTLNIHKAFFENNFTKTGYTFSGWNESSSEPREDIDYNDKYVFGFDKPIPDTISNKMTLYAVWEAHITNVTLNFNNGSGVTHTVNISYGDNSFNETPLPTPERNGYTFLGYFNESSGGVQVINSTLGLVQNAQNYTDDNCKWANDTRNIELWARWEKIPEPPSSSGTSSSYYHTTTYIGGINSEVAIGDNLTVFFNSTGGSHVDYQTNLHRGDKVTEPKNPTKDGYAFKAWYTANAYKWDFKNDTINKSFTLYANWTAIPQKPGISWFWIILLIIAGVVITAVIIKKIRDKKRDEEDYDVLS